MRLYTTGNKLFGYVLIAGQDVLLYKSDIVSHQLLFNLSVKRQKHQKKGGQSAPRIERERQRKELAYIKEICTLIKKYFLIDGIPNINGLIIAGPGEMKRQVLDCAEFSPALLKLVLHVMTTGEINNDSFSKVLINSIPYLNDQELLAEKEMHSQILETIRINSEKVLFGKEVPAAFGKGTLQTIYISAEQQATLQFEEMNGCTIKVFKSSLINDYGGIVGIGWY